MKHRFLTGLLAVAMLLMMLPTAAFAQEERVGGASPAPVQAVDAADGAVPQPATAESAVEPDAAPAAAMVAESDAVLQDMAASANAVPEAAAYTMATDVPYVDAAGGLYTCASAIEITADTDSLDRGWYVVNRDVSLGQAVASGEVFLILADGCTASLTDGIELAEGASLTIYGQAAGSGALKSTGLGIHGGGKLTVESGTLKGESTRGGSTVFCCREIQIKGGTVSSKATGIFTPTLGDVGMVTYISGGTVTLEQTNRGNTVAGALTITGGTLIVTACGNVIARQDVKISGGKVKLPAGFTRLSSDGAVIINGGCFAEGNTAEQTVYGKPVEKSCRVVDSGDTAYPYEVAGAVATVRIGEGEAEYYFTFESAWNMAAGASAPAVVTLLADAVAAGDGTNNSFGSDVGFADGAVFVPNNKTITLDLNNHKVDRGLTAAAEGGCVIKVGDGGTLTVKSTDDDGNGKITGGYNTGYGGGIDNRGSLTIESGSVAHNTSAYGGGIANEGTITMSGGSIANNAATACGGGVFDFGPPDFGAMNISGDLKISGNTGGNLALGEAKILNINAALIEGASVGITAVTPPVPGRPLAVTGANSTDYSSYFTSDDASCVIKNSGTGDAQVVQLAVRPMDVAITATTDPAKLTQPYAGGTFDANALFIFDPNCGAASYKLLSGADAGSITEAGVLSVSEAGAFTIQVDTAAHDDYKAGTATVTLTIQKGAGAGAVSMAGYTYAGKVSSPGLTGRIGTGTPTYYYTKTSTTTGGAKWENMAPTTLSAGDYYLYAEVAATDLYNGFTTGAVKFTVEKATVTALDLTALVTAPVKDAAPQSTLADGAEYTGKISWSGSPAKFVGNTVYTATVALTTTANYTFEGVEENGFSHKEAATVANAAGSGTVTLVFAAIEDHSAAAPVTPAATQTPTGPAGISTVPVTGEEAPLLLWVVLMAAAAAGLCCVFVWRRKSAAK